jgi:IS30 family transposase
VTAWSPEQIANRLEIDLRDDESVRISHEAIYHALLSSDSLPRIPGPDVADLQ